MTELGDRIRTARRAAKKTQADLANHLEIARVNVTQWESGTTRPDQARLPSIAEFLGVRLDWLMSDKGPMSDGAPPSGSGAVAELPIRGEVAAGQWLEIDNYTDLPHDPERVPVGPTPGIPAEFQFALRVRGNSLNRIANDGDILVCTDIIKSGARIIDGDLVIVERVKFQRSLREVTAKRVREVDAGYELWPESDDPKHQDPIRIDNGQHDDEDIAVIAKVLWIMRKP